MLQNCKVCTSEKLHFTWQKQRFWFVSINQPFHAPILEVSVWAPTPSPEDEVWNISEASVTNNVPVGETPHRPISLKSSTIGISCRNKWEKTESHNTKNTKRFCVAFIMLHPINATADDDQHQQCLQQGWWGPLDHGGRAPNAHSPVSNRIIFWALQRRWRQNEKEEQSNKFFYIKGCHHNNKHPNQCLNHRNQ